MAAGGKCPPLGRKRARGSPEENGDLFSEANSADTEVAYRSRCRRRFCLSKYGAQSVRRCPLAATLGAQAGGHANLRRARRRRARATTHQLPPLASAASK